jgi:hypothetical protein
MGNCVAPTSRARGRRIYEVRRNLTRLIAPPGRLSSLPQAYFANLHWPPFTAPPKGLLGAPWAPPFMAPPAGPPGAP